MTFLDKAEADALMTRYVPMTEPYLSTWCLLHNWHCRLLHNAKLCEGTDQERYYLVEGLKVANKKWSLFQSSLRTL